MSAGDTDQELETLLEYLKRNRGFDFTGYKRASLARRIMKRMETVGVRTHADYLDFLEVHAEEFAALFNTILINVTGFFRDPTAWEYLVAEVLPGVLDAKAAGDHVRVWSAGCASGEEAYTLAMILAERMGEDEYRQRVKIYATDIDEEALAKARHGTYSEREVDGVPPPLLEKYFERNESNYTFRRDLRRQVIFGRHDLIQDAPISRVDLLVCRNALMYFNAEVQGRILTRFHFALNERGVLFLGRAETMLTHASTFTPIDLKRRISVKVPRADLGLRDRLLLSATNGSEEGGRGLAQHHRLRDVALDAGPVAQLVVDSDGIVALANERARSFFGLLPTDFGRPLQDLRISYKPVELRSLLEQVFTERRPLWVKDVEWRGEAGEPRWADLQIAPLQETGGPMLGANITFTDVTAAKRLQRELEHANQEIEAAYEELQSTNEELETTNEELQSTVEELETTNEELHSSNEELETMNEELQSTNEELHTLNDELRERSEELNRVNGFLESILTSLRGAVVVLDTDLRILVWNHRAQDMWGLRRDEVVGSNFLALDTGLPVEKLKHPIRAAITSDEPYVELDLAATTRRGRGIVCHVTCTRMVGSNGSPRGVILVIEERQGGEIVAVTGDGDGESVRERAKPTRANRD
jgi:two-component system, chemotaxis family, CheB/CheR fusion protein